MITVAKFGGSSLANAKQFRKVKEIVEADTNRSVIVVSAPGKRRAKDNKITDLFYLLHAHITYGVDHDHVFDLIESRFFGIADELGLEFDLKQAFRHYREEIQNVSLDELVSRGEYLTARLLAEFIGYVFVDAKDVICFQYNSEVDWSETKKRLLDVCAKHKNIVIPGFYGSYPNGSIHIMPRGGSDLTGSIVAKALKAKRYENWTDVSGIMKADPKIVNHPDKIKEITYHELRELSYMGANVLHEEAIRAIQDANIPIHMLNTNAMDEEGTLIRKTCENGSSIITGIAGKKGFTVLTVTKSNAAAKRSVIEHVLKVFSKFRVNIEHIPSSIDAFSVIVVSKDIEPVFFDLMSEIHRIEDVTDVTFEKDMALISVVGRNMSTKPGIAGKLFSAIGDKGININMIAQSSQEINIVVGVKNQDLERTIRTIYDAF